MPKVAPGMLAMPFSTDANACMGWIEPARAPCSTAGPSTSRDDTPEQCTTVCLPLQEYAAHAVPIASSGVVMKTTSEASMAACGSSYARAPSTSRASSCADESDRLAAAQTTYPWRDSAAAMDLPTIPEPTNPIREVLSRGAAPRPIPGPVVLPTGKATSSSCREGAPGRTQGRRTRRVAGGRSGRPNAHRSRGIGCGHSIAQSVAAWRRRDRGKAPPPRCRAAK